MTYITNVANLLPEELLEIIIKIYGGGVTAAARDSEALSYGNGISGSSDYDKEMRNGISHVHVSAESARKHGQELAEIFGNKKEGSPNDYANGDEWKDQYNNELGRRIDEWMKFNNYTKDEINPKTGEKYTDDELKKIVDDLVVDAKNSGDIIGDPAQDPRTDGTEGPLNSDNVPIDPVTGEVIDPKSAVTWAGPNTDIDPETGKEKWKDSSQGRDYDHPEVQPPDIWDNPFNAGGYYASRGLVQVLDVAAGATDVVAAVYVGLNDLAGKVQGLLDTYYDAAQKAASDFAQAASDFAQDLADFLTQIGENPSGALDEAMKTVADAGGALFDGAMQGIQDIGEWMAGVWEAYGFAKATGSPLVLDLDGDGIELVSLLNTSVYWDIDQDGFAEATGWVGADDGLLAIDLNGDGVVTDHTELFGSLTEDGFTALSIYDTNIDGVIDINDAQFADLLVWQDVNQNGVSEANEIYTLADLNIVSINLNATQPTGLVIEGNDISHVSSYTVDDGVTGPQTLEIVDAWFQYDNINTNYIGDYTLDLASLFLPTLRGYGTLPDMHISASMDNDTTDPNSLMSLLQQFSTKNFSDMFVQDSTVMDEVRNIIFRWAGVDTVDPLSRGGTVDARELEFLEALTGEPFLQRGTGSDPVLLGAEAVDRAFETAIYPIVGKLVAQAAGSALFNDGVYYNPVTDTFEGFTGFNQASLDVLLAKSLDANQVTDKTAFWISVVNTVNNSIGVANLPVDALAALEATLVASDASLSVQSLLDRITWNIESKISWSVEGDFINGTDGDDVYDGSVGNDHYYAGYGTDILSGGLGDDTLYGGSGNDIISGQLGNDYLVGESGDDTYLFSSGHGDDVIYEGAGLDKIVFGAGITLNDIIFDRISDYALKLSIDPVVGSGSITLDNQFSGGIIETLEFNDGTVFDMNTRDTTYIGTSGNDTMTGVLTGSGGSGVDYIYGMDGDDTIYGNASNYYSYTEDNYLYGGNGNDTIYGDRSSDTIDGGAGNDSLYGGIGADFLTGGLGDDIVQGYSEDDTYYFNYGDGNDVFEEWSGNDKIVFGAGITHDDLTFIRTSTYALEIAIDSKAGGSITLDNQFSAGMIETLEFSDGSLYDMISMDVTYIGTSGNDTMTGVLSGSGGSGVDYIYGMDGDDTIYGYASGSYSYTEGNYLYGGNGNDIIYGDRSSDTIDGGADNDTLYSGYGNDFLTGGLGDDYLAGDNGDDTYLFSSGHGDDIIYEASGLDKIVFGAGITHSDLTFTRISPGALEIAIDPVAGGGSITIDNQFSGGVIESLEFSDGAIFDLNIQDYTYYGTSGNDSMSGIRSGSGGSGVDYIYGMDGDDTIYGYASGSYSYTEENYLYGGNGNDIIYGDRSSDTMDGGAGNDTFYGGIGADFLTGGLGDDIVQGYSDDDTYYFNYGDGNDIFEEWNGNDTIILGANITQDMVNIYRSSNSDVKIDIDNGLGGSITLAYQTYGGAYIFENLNFADGSTIYLPSLDLTLNGTSANDTLYGVSYGGSGVDTIYGHGGNDTIYGYYSYSDYQTNYLHGGDGNDTLHGSKGDDFYYMGSGNDYVQELSGGSDTYVYTGGLDTIYEYLGANDTLILDIDTTINDLAIAGGSHTNIVIDAGINEINLMWFLYSGNYLIENIEFQDGFSTSLGTYASWLYGTDIADTLTGTISNDTIIGKGGDDIISGDAGDDDIHGGIGNDTINGNDGIDDLWGGDGSDYLYGGAGDDVLSGSAGVDMLYGQGGADTFMFEAASAFTSSDNIQDFNLVEGDKIDISDLLTGYDPLTDLITDFIQITDDGTHSYLAVDSDGGANNFVQVANMFNVTGLTDEEALETSGNLITA